VGGWGDSSAPTLCGFDTRVLPDWVLFHVPHDSTFIPPSERSKLLLNDAELNAELRGSATTRVASLNGIVDESH